jgi:hypothetical protein
MTIFRHFETLSKISKNRIITCIAVLFVGLKVLVAPTISENAVQPFSGSRKTG